MQRRQRHQEGSLQVRSHGKRKMWVVLYREANVRRYFTLGLFSKMSKSEAQKKQAELMGEVNAKAATAPDPNVTFGSFLEGVVLPFLRSKWKASTAGTTENRMRFHLMGEFEEVKLCDLTLNVLQAFLSRKSATHSRSIVAHLRWDLRSVFKLAIAEGYAERDPTGALFTPKRAAASDDRSMKKEEVESMIGVLDRRERVVAHLAIFAGIRPGEILAMQRRHASADCRQVTIDQRLYRGLIDTPKTDSSNRCVAIPSKTAALLLEWMDCVGPEPEAWVFASENPANPMWRDNMWCRLMKPRLKAIGLEWANFQVMRRTHASLGHEAGIDPKVSADQRGHGIGVALDVYTHSCLEQRAEAAERLEKAVLTA